MQDICSLRYAMKRLNPVYYMGNAIVDFLSGDLLNMMGLEVTPKMALIQY